MSKPGNLNRKGGKLMTTDQNKTTMRIFLEKLDKSISAIEEFFIPDCPAHLPGIPDPTDREGFRQFVAMLYAAFPDLHHTVEEQIAENDKVASIINVSGTHKGDFQGIAPTGRPVMFDDFMITRIQGGKVVELWAQFDALKLLQQLGVFQLQAQSKG
jgi:predicted ester cyclase